MWLLAMFDLPVKTKEARRQYTRFRKSLLREGFCMLQYSVYGRHCNDEEVAAIYRQRVRDCLPANGQIRVVSVTEAQFAKQEIYYGQKARRAEEKANQMLLF